jgi:hypothetical protein
LDSAGLFVVLSGVDTLIGMPELRGAAPLTLYGLGPEKADAEALLAWRAMGSPPPAQRLLRPPLRHTLFVAFTFLLGLLAGVPFMVGWPRDPESAS